eukprot:TRINITY_DN6002_c0_g1_i1.p1 TRINITY_DN6002_c0_g1~~TRINITY_DN6002_c0_g1_i1.p1  ORF type:complete len:326 (+),score=95.35 TRINITY_DN6002_c0_g1_i1:115-1092(+)
MFANCFLTLAVFVSCIQAAVVFNGDFSFYNRSSDLDLWSFSNQVGQYQCYIFGQVNMTKTCSSYIQLDPAFCDTAFNPNCTKGAQYYVDNTSFWHNQTFERAELIPQNQPMSNATLVYRFSMRAIQFNASYEHQLVFFEGHFADIKLGNPCCGNPLNSTLAASLQFLLNGNYWLFDPARWNNFALVVDYNASTISLWHSYDGDNITQVVSPTASSISAAADYLKAWHVGILRLPYNFTSGYQDPSVTMMQYSNIWIEDALSFPTAATVPAGTSAAAVPAKNQLSTVAIVVIAVGAFAIVAAVIALWKVVQKRRTPQVESGAVRLL